LEYLEKEAHETNSQKKQKTELLSDSTVLENCSICMEDICCKDVVNVSCGHLFHQKCITSWSKTSRSKTCPLCRTDYVAIESQHITNFKPEIPKQPKSFSSSSIIDLTQ